jgi:hypothetical protein
MTSRSTWKQAESKAAKFLGSERTPLSGGNSKITRSDSLHKDLFIEGKYRAKCATRTLFNATKKLAEQEQKVPILTLRAARQNGFLLVIHSDDLDAALILLRKARRESLDMEERVEALSKVPPRKK